MFDAVLDRASIPEGRLGTGSAIAVGLHAAVFALALLISARPPKSTPKEKPNLPIVVLNDRLGKRSASGASQNQAKGESTGVRKKRRDFVIPKDHEDLAPKPTSPPAVTPPSDHDRVGSADPNGTDVSQGLCKGSGCLSGVSANHSLGVEVLPFGEGMTRPHLIQGARIEYTREATQARVQGTMILQCILTPEGRMTACHVLKTVPHMEEAVRRAVSTWRYSPVLFQGRPAAVKYKIEVHLVAP